MTKEQCREAGATMIAWADGKTIQWRRRDQSEWHDIEPACTATILSWDWDEFEYRVKRLDEASQGGQVMSDTPRTDAAYFKPLSTMYDMAGEMKRMERELNAANERIKRLEEAGDGLLELCEADESKFHLADAIDARCAAWIKAKEAKP